MSKIISSLILRGRYISQPLWLRMMASNAQNMVRGIFQRYPLSSSYQNGADRDPLFIISAGRSGTTLLRSMLVAGGQIAIPPETQLIHKLIIKYLTSQGLGWDNISHLIISSFESHFHYHLWQTNLYPIYKKAIDLPPKERSLARLIDIVFMEYAAQNFPEAVMWGDQSPLHTFYLPWIQLVYPKAKYIHMLRDGRDVISSFIKMNGSANLEEATYRWVKSIERVSRLKKEVAPGQFLEIRYEDLVTDSALTLQRITEFAGLNYTEKMLDYWKLPSTMEHKHHEHHRNLAKPVFASSKGKWEERLTEQQQKYVIQKISALLKELEYSG